MKHFVLYDHISQVVTMSGVAKNRGRHPDEASLGVLEDAAMVVDSEDQIIQWVGQSKDLPKEYQNLPNAFSAEGEVWIPELVECHTHLIYAGSRHHDYALRCKGKTYLEIGKEGGGILSTLAHTREASLEELVEKGQSELERFQKFGVGVVEIKSGYGLTLESETKILEAVEILRRLLTVKLISTFMPAHAVPKEFSDASAYVETICQEWIPEISSKKLATFFDVFIEDGYFSVEHASKLCQVATKYGFKLKLHCDQFTDLGGVALGVELGATSIDHLDHISGSSIQKLASSETVAVLLPGASLFTGTPYPPARKLIDAGARVALSTDYNPGTSPSRNLPLMATIACSQMKMTVPEVLAAITYNSAAALGLEAEYGSFEVGKKFNACQLQAESYEVLPYSFGELT